MLFEARTGLITSRDGGVNAVRGDTSGALVVAQGHASFQEAVRQGNVFSVCNQAGVTSQAGISATTPVLTLYNSPGSGKDCVVWYVGVTFTVVFAAVSAIFVCVGSDIQTAAVTGTLTTTHRNMKVGLTQNPAARTFLAATLPVAPVAIGLLGAGLTGAVNLMPHLQTLERWYNGALILIPGSNLTLQTGAASGASGMFCEYIWEEVPS
jgi:hypothetical protein